MRNSTILLLAMILFFGGTAMYKSFEYNNYYTEVENVVSSNLFDNEFLNFDNYERISPYDYLEINVKPNTDYTIKIKDSFDLDSIPIPTGDNRILRINNKKEIVDPNINIIVNIRTDGNRYKRTIKIKSNEF